MLLEHAHHVLNGYCKAPKPLGFIRQRPVPNEPYEYMMVSQYCPVLPGYYSSLTLVEALALHAKKPIIRKIEWRNICLSLIHATQLLQKNDIYHNDLVSCNILLEISDNRVEPVIIDFGAGTRGKTGNRRPMYGPLSAMQPSSTPELYRGPDPLPTSDLHSISYVILRICAFLNLPKLEDYILEYRLQKPEKRDGHKKVFEKVYELFTKAIEGSVDLTVEDRAPPLQGK